MYKCLNCVIKLSSRLVLPHEVLIHQKTGNYFCLSCKTTHSRYRAKQHPNCDLKSVVAELIPPKSSIAQSLDVVKINQDHLHKWFKSEESKLFDVLFIYPSLASDVLFTLGDYRSLYGSEWLESNVIDFAIASLIKEANISVKCQQFHPQFFAQLNIDDSSPNWNKLSGSSSSEKRINNVGPMVTGKEKKKKIQTHPIN